MENLCCKIEYLRQRMHVTALEKGISHPDVLMISCELDEVLNEFHKMSLVEKIIRDDKWLGSRIIDKFHFCSIARKTFNRINFSNNWTSGIKCVK